MYYYILTFFLGMIVGVLVFIGAILLFLRNYELNKKMPYRWVCEEGECKVRFGARSIGMLEQLIQEHQQSQHTSGG